MMILPTRGGIKRRVLSRTIDPRDSAWVDSPLSLGRDLVPFAPAVSHRFV